MEQSTINELRKEKLIDKYFIEAPGAFEIVIVPTMLPLDNTDDQNKDIEIKSFLGKVEVVIS